MIVGRTWQDLLMAAGIVAIAFFTDSLWGEDFQFPAVIPTLLGTALAFFIGFSNSQAYDRWWEARMICGAITNESRSWARSCIYYIRDEPELVKALVLRQIAFVYALRANLRGRTDAQFILDVRDFVGEAELEQLLAKQNRHNALLDWQSRDLQRLYAEGRIDNVKFLELDRRIVSLCDEMGKAERIHNTVFPPTYNYYTRIFVWIFILCLTIMLLGAMGVLGVIMGFVVGYVFLVSQGIGMTLLNPFDPVISGVPLDQITRGIEINLLEMLGRTDLPEPVRSVHNDYVM